MNFKIIKSWQIALTGSVFLFTIPIFLVLEERSSISGEHNEMFGLGLFFAFLLSIPVLISLIPAFLLRSDNMKMKIYGALSGILFGTILMVVMRILIGTGGTINPLITLFLSPPFLSGIFLFISGCYFFLKENKTTLLYNKIIKILAIFCIILIVFSWSIVKASFTLHFDANAEIKECQIKSIPARLLSLVFFNLLGYESVSPNQLDYNCYSEIARKNLDSDLCERLPVQGPGYVKRGACLTYVAINKKDPERP